MTKKILLLACIGFATGAFAQQNINWEAQAGLSSTSFLSGPSKIGFHVGVRANKEFPSVTKGFYGNVGAFISSKGSTPDLSGTTESRAYYLDIPVHVGYKKNLNDKFALFGEAGPYLGCGLWGTTKTTTPFAGKTGSATWFEGIAGTTTGFEGIAGTTTKDKAETTTEDFFESAPRLAYGLGVRVGMEFKQKYTASIAYDHSLSLDFNSLMLTVGYKF